MNVTKLREDFPILKRQINGPSSPRLRRASKPIVYLDSAATSLKPRSVVEAMRKYYEEYTANIHRGVYRLSEEATEAYEGAREKVAKFIGAKSAKEIVFVRNATEAINLVMYAWGKKNVGKGDEIIVTIMEHHANFVPWQRLCEEVGAKLKILQLTKDGLLDLDNLEKLVSKKTKLVTFTHVSNVLGTINPVKEIIKESRIQHFDFAQCKNPESRILIDGAQAVPHMSVNVQELGCDWYVFSGHKMLGPTGIGVLWGRQELLNEMEPFMFGGEMIREVRIDGTTFKDAPDKFEAGTPHIAGAIGLGAAVDYLESLGMEAVRGHERELTEYAVGKLVEIGGVGILGPLDSKSRGGVVAFTVDGIHPHDVAQVLDEDNIYIRAGHHCAMPLHAWLGVSATCRASFYVYNTKKDIDKLVDGLREAIRKFKVQS